VFAFAVPAKYGKTCATIGTPASAMILRVAADRNDLRDRVPYRPERILANVVSSALCWSSWSAGNERSRLLRRQNMLHPMTIRLGRDSHVFGQHLRLFHLRSRYFEQTFKVTDLVDEALTHHDATSVSYESEWDETRP